MLYFIINEIVPFFYSWQDRVFHFAEIPLALGAIYYGLQHIPVCIVQPYETVLLSISPLITIFEGLATMIIIVSSGQGLSSFLESRPAIYHAFFGAICLGLYTVSTMAIFSLYYSGQIHTLVTASLVAVILTLLAVLSIGTVMLEHGVVTDSALLFLYITYNIWNLTRKIEPVEYNSSGLKLMHYISSVSWSSPTHDSLVSVIESIFKMFSVELLTGLFIQMSVLLMAWKLIDNSEDPDEVKAVKSFNFREWLFNVLWPCFGKSILILIYTYAWLAHGVASPVPWYIEPSLWRWINIFFCLTIYLKHLLSPPDDEFAPIWSHSD